jgi:hypothetical protein
MKLQVLLDSFIHPVSFEKQVAQRHFQVKPRYFATTLGACRKATGPVQLGWLTMLLFSCSCVDLFGQVFHWNNPGSQSFSMGPWSPSTPTFLAGTDETLSFGSFGTSITAGYTATNDIASFTRVINFNNNSGANSTIAIATPNTLTLNSTGLLGSQLNQNGFGNASIGNFAMGGDLLIGGSGAGNLTVTGLIDNISGRRLTINQTGSGFYYTGPVVRISGGNWGATGETVINNGNVALTSSSSLGTQSTNRITINGGSISF